MRPYRITFTEPAQRTILERFDMEAVLVYIRHELEMSVFEGADPEVGINDLLSHVVEMESGDPAAGIWICTVAGADHIEVDSGRYVPGLVVQSGPFAGRTLMIPVGDSADDDDLPDGYRRGDDAPAAE